MGDNSASSFSIRSFDFGAMSSPKWFGRVNMNLETWHFGPSGGGDGRFYPTAPVNRKIAWPSASIGHPGNVVRRRIRRKTPRQFDVELLSVSAGILGRRAVTLKHLQIFAGRWLTKLQYKRKASCVLYNFGNALIVVAKNSLRMKDDYSCF